MFKTLAVRSDGLFIPLLALIAIVINGICATRMSPAVFWLITAAIFGVLMCWQRHLRITYSKSPHSEMSADQMAAVRPYAIIYGILYSSLFAGLLCIIYFQLGMPFFIANFAAWFIRRDVWLAILLREFKKNGPHIPAAI